MINQFNGLAVVTAYSQKVTGCTFAQPSTEIFAEAKRPTLKASTAIPSQTNCGDVTL